MYAPVFFYKYSRGRPSPDAPYCKRDSALALSFLSDLLYSCCAAKCSLINHSKLNCNLKFTFILWTKRMRRGCFAGIVCNVHIVRKIHQTKWIECTKHKIKRISAHNQRENQFNRVRARATHTAQKQTSFHSVKAYFSIFICEQRIEKNYLSMWI